MPQEKYSGLTYLDDMKKIYHLKTCNTCQRIIGELNTDGVEMQEIKTNHISADQLDGLKEKVGSYEALFNKRAQKYRQQGLNEKSLSEADFRELILGEYTFLKRPVIVVGDTVFVGNSKKVVEAAKAVLSK